MAAFNFPASPSVGQIYTPAAGISFSWTGTHWDRVAGPLSTAMPAGVIAPYAGATAPLGTLLCDGKTFVRADYPLLFAVIGTTYGAGDGSTTAGLPDLRGRVPFGSDTMGGIAANRLTLIAAALGSVGGHEAIFAHAHTVNITSGDANADHQHLVNGTSSGHNTDHVHYVSGTTAVDSPDHTHAEVVLGGTTGGTAAAGSGRTNSTVQTGGASARHTHTFAAWSGGVNTDHSHTLNFWSGGISANHQHAINGATAIAGTGDAQNIPPGIIANYIIFTGA